VTASVDLYRALVLDHGKHPRNVGTIDGATHAAEGDNPLCGDAVRIEALVDGAIVKALRFAGEGCVLVTASASLMTERLIGKSRTDAARAIATLQAWCTRGQALADEPSDLAAVLCAFADVHRHPGRVACATLPWQTLGRALGD
jgi:nitrogen fixation protein NifU and related proteins